MGVSTQPSGNRVSRGTHEFDLELVGSVHSGREKAARHMRDNTEELRRLTGENLFAGSLNLVLEKPLLLSASSALVFEGGRRMLWPALLGGCSVWAYRWKHSPLHIVEILATDNLRGKLGLKDHEAVELKMRSGDSKPLALLSNLAWHVAWFGRGSRYYTSERHVLRTKNFTRIFGATQKGLKER